MRNNAGAALGGSRYVPVAIAEKRKLFFSFLSFFLHRAARRSLWASHCEGFRPRASLGRFGRTGGCPLPAQDLGGQSDPGCDSQPVRPQVRREGEEPYQTRVKLNLPPGWFAWLES